MKKFILLLSLIFLTSFTNVIYVFADNTTAQEGEVYQGDDGKYYKIIDGKKIEIDYGSASDGSITDAFKDYNKTTKPDAEAMAEIGENITSPIGTLISVIIYLIFAFTAITTVIDLAWICIPPLRPFLYDDVSNNNIGTANANLLGRNENWTNLANNSMNRANQHNMQSQAYAQQAQNLAAMGDVNGAQRAMRRANNQASLAQHSANWANSHMQSQAQSDARRYEANQRTLQNAQRRAENNRSN